jgi:hypothetical protein
LTFNEAQLDVDTRQNEADGRVFWKVFAKHVRETSSEDGGGDLALRRVASMMGRAKSHLQDKGPCSVIGRSQESKLRLPKSGRLYRKIRRYLQSCYWIWCMFVSGLPYKHPVVPEFSWGLHQFFCSRVGGCMNWEHFTSKTLKMRGWSPDYIFERNPYVDNAAEQTGLSGNHYLYTVANPNAALIQVRSGANDYRGKVADVEREKMTAFQRGVAPTAEILATVHAKQAEHSRLVEQQRRASQSFGLTNHRSRTHGLSSILYS